MSHHHFGHSICRYDCPACQSLPSKRCTFLIPLFFGRDFLRLGLCKAAGSLGEVTCGNVCRNKSSNNSSSWDLPWCPATALQGDLDNPWSQHFHFTGRKMSNMHCCPTAATPCARTPRSRQRRASSAAQAGTGGRLLKNCASTRVANTSVLSPLLRICHTGSEACPTMAIS